MTKWLCTDWEDKPKKVEVLKQTEKTVTIENPYYKIGQRLVSPDIFDTFDEAKQFLIDRQTRKLESIRFQLDRENGRLGNIKGLKNPDEVQP